MLRILLILVFTTSFCFAQNYTSTIRGTVRDADTGLPLSGAAVTLDKAGEGVSSDEKGSFRFVQIPLGRYVLKVSYLGYESIAVPEILLESGRENVQDIRLNPSGQQLQEATITSNRPGAFNSVQEITIEQTLRYAATYLDPARVATSFPGVAAANDQANGLVIRGNSPNGMQWRLEGVEIVNPNHLSNAGTFSDRATTTGGGVNILSTQLLSNSYFLSGAFPAQYGNALSGVLDMNLRKGNDEKPEFVAQVGLIGIDIAAEGPFSKKSKASYLANYRYSFTGLLSGIGIDFGGEANKYQDFSFNIHLPTEKAGTFTIFGLGGISENVFTAERDSSLWEVQKDGRDIIFNNKMGAGGITHALSIGSRTAWNTTVVASGLTTTRESYDVNALGNNRTLTDRDELTKERLSASSYIMHRIDDKSRLKAGLYLTGQFDKIGLIRYWGRSENAITGWLVQPFVNWTYRISSRITSEVGLHAMLSTLKTNINKGNSSTLEPRAALKWQVNESQLLSFSYGLHSQLQLPQVYLSNFNTVGATGNLHVGPTKSHHLVVGYQKNFVKTSSLKLEAYWQQLIDVPIDGSLRNSFSAINLVENEISRRLTNTGTGRNYGIEATYQKLLTDQYYVLASGSLYDATYVGSDGIRRDSRFNGRHTFSFTAGKEFRRGETSTWGLNAKILWIGGFRDTPIDIEASTVNNTTVYLQDQAFSLKMKDYFRPDIRIYWKKSKARYSRTLALDLQNITSTKNEAYNYYDTFQKKVVAQYQLGLIPVLSYRWEF